MGERANNSTANGDRSLCSLLLARRDGNIDFRSPGNTTFRLRTVATGSADGLNITRRVDRNSSTRLVPPISAPPTPQRSRDADWPADEGVRSRPRLGLAASSPSAHLSAEIADNVRGDVLRTMAPNCPWLFLSR